MGMQTGTVTLEDDLVVSYETKHILTLRTRNRLPSCLSECVKICVHTKTGTQMVTGALSMIIITKKLEPTKLSLNRIKKPQNFHSTEYYYSAIKEMSYHVRKRHAGTLNAYHLVKEASLKRPHTV